MTVSSRAVSGERSHRLGYAICYALYALFLPGAYVALWVWHRSASEIGRTWFPWGGDRPAAETVYLLIMTVVGLVLFVFLVAAEGYLRRAVRDGRLAGAYLRAALLFLLLLGGGAAALEVALRLRRA